MRRKVYRRVVQILFVLSPFTTVTPCAAEPVNFNRDIRPILSASCLECHGADANSREAELRLDLADDKLGPFADRDGSYALKPGDFANSLVWKRISTNDNDEVMPPADSKIDRLKPEQIELIKQWIVEGAEYQDFWSFVPPQPQSAPDVTNHDWTLNRIDRFVLARMEEEGLTPQPPADKRTLIRRLSFDLTGLPPTRDEIHAFLADDSPDAYENLVERLLASSHYGEHMTKYWLDLVRFADTNGIHHDHYREMTPYRDWVIRAFNDNLRFDDFIKYQLAGDLYDQPTIDQQIASGFNRLHLVIDVGTAIPEESFTRNVVDRVTAVGTAFMGLTVGCAVCHDHKYDPVTQKDFYRLYAFFNNIDSTPETPGNRVHSPFIRLPNATDQSRLNEIEEQIASKAAELNLLKGTSEETSSAEQITVTETELKALEKSKNDLEETFPVSLVMKERSEVRPTHILIRGVYDRPGELVDRGTPSFLPPLQSASDIKTRMDLANWLTDKRHPLTARVTVNRFWQQVFGVGIVKTSEDFGTQGSWPSHPALLDDLTNHFVESGWNVKELVKSIVMSQTYRQSSSAPPAAFKADPENRLLARGSRFRLDAEMIRDQILSVSGLLNPEMYGKSVKPPQPPNLWKSVSMASSSTYAFEADSGDKIYRRSLYSFWKRAMPPPQMTIFDAPTREACIARRERTNTPLQALVLMNEGQYFKAAQQFAQQLLADPNANDEQRIIDAYETVTSHLPDRSEMASLAVGLAAMRNIYREDMDSTKSITADIESISDENRVELAAYTMIVNSLFNLDVTKTRN